MSEKGDLAAVAVDDNLQACPSQPNSGSHTDLAAIIAEGVAASRFSPVSSVGWFEACATSEGWEEGLTDESLRAKLEQVPSGSVDSKRVRTIFIPWATYDKQLAITPALLLRLCTTFDIPALFIRGIWEREYWIKPGNGLFLYKDRSGLPVKLEFFYRYSYGLHSGRAYVFSKYDFVNKVTINICINASPEAETQWVESVGVQVAASPTEKLFALHVLIASLALDRWDADGSKLRSELLVDELSKRVKSPKVQAITLHRLAQRFYILVEDLSDLEERMEFLRRVSESFTNVLPLREVSICALDEIYNIQYMLSKCRHSKRWVSNYRDRANIRINLAFHLSTQMDNDLNVQISNATTAIARDTQRDSSSMITIAAVTMFFLPGTFVSALFSMVFFNFQQDENGVQEFQVSDRWWYFLAATIPTTCVVFAIWIVWQKFRFSNHHLEADATRFLKWD